MGAQQPGGIVSLILQCAVLIVGIVLIITSRYWSNRSAVIASGVFFINIFWITMVLRYDLRLWALIRNTVPGAIIMLGVPIINLAVIAVLALIGAFRGR
jgi:hypothetical protein